MAKELDKRTASAQEEEFEIFGAHKTREQIKAEEKARKQAEREALRRELKERHTTKTKGGNEARRFDGWTVAIALVLIVLLGVGAMVMQFSRSAEMEQFQRDESRPSWVGGTPKDETENTLSGAATEAFYTRGGHLAVVMTLTNKSNVDLQFAAVEATVMNGDQQIVAQGYAQIPQVIVVPAQGTDTYTLYISPEHIQLKEDPLTTATIYVNVTPAPVTN